MPPTLLMLSSRTPPVMQDKTLELDLH
jgi:hypothetical protein